MATNSITHSIDALEKALAMDKDPDPEIPAKARRPSGQFWRCPWSGPLGVWGAARTQGMVRDRRSPSVQPCQQRPRRRPGDRPPRRTRGGGSVLARQSRPRRSPGRRGYRRPPTVRAFGPITPCHQRAILSGHEGSQRVGNAICEVRRPMALSCSNADWAGGGNASTN
jgi:hypothetical protein